MTSETEDNGAILPENSHEPAPSPSSDVEQRLSGARLRQQRRKERQQQRETVVSSARRTVRQTAPVRRVQLPKVNMRYVRPVIAGIAAVIFMVGLIFAVGLFDNAPAEIAPNALWLGEEWTHTSRDASEIEALVQRLRNNEIGTVYAWVSWLQPDNVWAGGRESTGTFTAVEPQVQTFVQQFSAAYPEANLYGWIRVPTGIGEEYRLDSEALVNSVTAFSSQVVNVLGFDGVFVEAGPIMNGDVNFAPLLQSIRGAIGSASLLAAALPPDWTPVDVDIPKPSVIAEGMAWDREYKQRIALLLDQVVLQVYNSYLDQPEAYEAWVAYQVQTYAEAVNDLQTGTDVLISLPVYASAPPAHDSRVENLNTALAGLRDGLQAAGETAPVVVGVALYADWDMDAEAWSLYKSEWVDR